MPISGGKYVSPTWHNNAAPALDAAELQAMTDTIEGNQEPQSSAVQLSAAAQAALGLGSGSTLDDAMEVLQQGETLFETTISQSGTQLNINVDTTNWGNYQYVFVIIDAALSRANAYMRVRLNNSTSQDQSCCYFQTDFYEPNGDRKFVAMTRAASANSERAVLCFNVFGNRANNIVCHMKSTTAYSWGTFDGIRYSQLTQINLICTSSGSSIQSGAHIKIVGVK